MKSEVTSNLCTAKHPERKGKKGEIFQENVSLRFFKPGEKCQSEISITLEIKKMTPNSTAVKFWETEKTSKAACPQKRWQWQWRHIAIRASAIQKAMKPCLQSEFKTDTHIFSTRFTKPEKISLKRSEWNSIFHIHESWLLIPAHTNNDRQVLQDSDRWKVRGT